MKTLSVSIVILSACSLLSNAATTMNAAKAINSLGVDLLQKSTSPDANALLSPYSIQSALAMTYAGADGETRAEMAKVLHYPKDDTELHSSFAALRKALDEVMRDSAKHAEAAKRYGGSSEPIVLTTANRLFGQIGHDFRKPFLDLTRTEYGASLEPVDFKDGPAVAKLINDWVAEETRQRIRDIVPANALNAATRLVLANAIYLKAQWEDQFHEYATQPHPFHVSGGKTIDVPTMTHATHIGYAERTGFKALAIPYQGGRLQFVILLPDDVNGLANLERKLTEPMLSESANLTNRDVILSLPKFRIEPPTLNLAKQLGELGMKTAFDQPAGSANFDRMAPRRPIDYLYISAIYHKTFLDLDEKGTEAAAATIVAVAAGAAPMERPKPIEVKVDRPFLFAIQHRGSGACLFLGRVTNPGSPQ